MKIILVTAGSYGDILPFVYIGEELKLRGYKVTLVTSQFFQKKVEQTGLEFYGFSTTDAYEKILADPLIFNTKKSAKVFAHDLLLPAIEPVYNYIIGEYNAEKKQNSPAKILIITTGFCFGARIASEKFNIPIITIKLAPVQLRIKSDRPNHVLFNKYMPNWFTESVWWLYDNLVTDPLIKSEINKFRHRLGLEPVSRVLNHWWNSPQQIFGLFPDWFMRIDKHWPPNSDLIGFPLPSIPEQQMSEDIERFLKNNPEPIVFTAGTAVATANSFFSEAVKITRELQKPAIFLTQFRDSLPEDLPQNSLYINFIPLSSLLPRVSALVHPGGIGTISEAIRAGIPQLIVPVVNDQFDNGKRVDNLGLGFCVSRKNFTVAKIVPKLKKLLTCNKIHNILSIRSRTLSLDNLGFIGDRIENFIKAYPSYYPTTHHPTSHYPTTHHPTTHYPSGPDIGIPEKNTQRGN